MTGSQATHYVCHVAVRDDVLTEYHDSVLPRSDMVQGLLSVSSEGKITWVVNAVETFSESLCE